MSVLVYLYILLFPSPFFIPSPPSSFFHPFFPFSLPSILSLFLLKRKVYFKKFHLSQLVELEKEQKEIACASGRQERPSRQVRCCLQPTWFGIVERNGCGWEKWAPKSRARKSCCPGSWPPEVCLDPGCTFSSRRPPDQGALPSSISHGPLHFSSHPPKLIAC